jgi:hypothetical protein
MAPLKGKLKSLTRTSDYITWFHKYFMCVTYSPFTISCTVLCTHTPMQYFQNELSYPATDLCHTRKMFMLMA